MSIWKVFDLFFWHWFSFYNLVVVLHSFGLSLVRLFLHASVDFYFTVVVISYPVNKILTLPIRKGKKKKKRTKIMFEENFS